MNNCGLFQVFNIIFIKLQGLTIDEFAREKLDLTSKELIEEREEALAVCQDWLDVEKPSEASQLARLWSLPIGLVRSFLNSMWLIAIHRKENSNRSSLVLFIQISIFVSGIIHVASG